MAGGRNLIFEWGGGLLEKGVAAFRVPFPSFLTAVTNLPHLIIML